MTTKHTPGPWSAKYTSGAGLSVHADVSKALGDRYSKDCPIYHLGNDACGLQISYELWTQFPREEWDAMQQANAHLMAAAPELLSALEQILEAFVDDPLTHQYTSGTAADAARAAIAKAKGEQQ